MSVVQPLDLERIFVDYFAGGYTLFYLIMMIFVAYMSAKFRMTNQITLLMLVVMVLMFAKWVPLFYLMLIAIIGLLIYYTTSKLIKG